MILKPYVCVACEKVIVAKDQVASLIGLFSKLIVPVPSSTNDIPKDAVAPISWVVFSTWDTETGDENRQYSLCTQIVYPDGSPFGEPMKHNIPVEAGKRAQMIVEIHGMPIGQAGNYTVRTWIEENRQKLGEPIEFKFGIEWRCG